MKGPFFLPDSVKEGDHIELEEMGAYSTTMKNNFNGFFSEPKVFIEKVNNYKTRSENLIHTIK